jgi:hypothetical protein
MGGKISSFEKVCIILLEKKELKFSYSRKKEILTPIITKKVISFFKNPPNLEIENSKLNHAGEGLFLKGKLNKGSVLCLYPGKIYFPMCNQNMISSTSDSTEILEIHPESKYVIVRNDNILIDGEDIQDNLKPHYKGHKINHSFNPNIIQLDYDFDNFEGNDLHYTYSKDWFVHIDSGETYKVPEEKKQPKGIIFITNRDIENEEVFLDYKLKKPHPEWYKS